MKIILNLQVKVSGVAYNQRLEAEPSLSHVYAWEKRNVYNQKVYGVVRARVDVGYEYEGCRGLVWVTRSVRMRGFDVDISDVGGWNLNVHHHFNAFQGTKPHRLKVVLSIN